MNDDGGPKDYSRLYVEERPPPPIPSIRTHQHLIHHQPNHINQFSTATTTNSNATLKPHNKLAAMDGACQPLKHRELDLREVVLKLQDHISQANSHAKDALSQHYSSFVKAKSPKYKVLVKYPRAKNQQEDVVYAIRIYTNSLQAVKDKLPKRGKYRYFFKTSNCLEEIESDDSPLPIYAEKDGYKQIYVHLFER